MSYIFFNVYTLSIIIAYLLGSIPFGVLITKLFNKGDLRKVGSGNIGATNVMRVGGLRLAGLVWILDMMKAVLAVWLCSWIGPAVFGYVDTSGVAMAFGVWGGFAAIVGHCFPIWLKFRGGKGVSCLFGVLLAVNPILFIVCGIEWLVIALGTGYSSAGALIAFCLMPVLGFFISFNVGVAFLAIALLCLWRHRENVLRLISGKESKIEWKWKK
jgi:glycerol-3-phosphate acyltransferase PlsY